MQKGMLYAALAFLSWGLLPLYFHALGQVPVMEILAHRMLWSVLFLLAMLALRHQWSWLATLAARPRVVASFVLSAVLLSTNWFLYIWAVNNGHVIDASLGYFINPLVNVMLGYLLLKERLRTVQWCAIGLAACGVAWLTWQTGSLPWIALILAFSFGGYGLLRKTAALGALEGLSFETMLLFPLALVYLVWLTIHGQNTFLNTESDALRALLVLGGPATAIPLLLFAAGARRVPLSVLGMLQYMSPSLQLLLGVWVFHEAFAQERLAGFILIWSALLVYAFDGWRHRA